MDLGFSEVALVVNGAEWSVCEEEKSGGVQTRAIWRTEGQFGWRARA